jgi:hypothetical protein
VGAQYLPWSAEHILGTDKLGRDMLSRLIYGARNTVGIAFLTTRSPSSSARSSGSGRRCGGLGGPGPVALRRCADGDPGADLLAPAAHDLRHLGR